MVDVKPMVVVEACDHAPLHNRSYHLNAREHLTYVVLCPERIEPQTLSLSFVLEAHAQVNVELVCASRNATINISCVLAGEGSAATIRGACVAKNNDAVCIVTTQHHTAPHTHSSCRIKTMVNDRAFVSYTGMIRVEENARCSVSSQENKNMIVGGAASAVSIPRLEVIAHDVQCAHGSATGNFDQESLVYAAARGIDEARMKQLLTKAFFADTVSNKQAVAFLQGLLS